MVSIGDKTEFPEWILRAAAASVPENHERPKTMPPTIPDNDPERPKLLEPRPGLWVRQEIDNIGWCDTGAGVLVVDALERPESAAEVLDAIRTTTAPAPVRWVVNTHTHFDHTALNPVFQERFGAEIINARTTSLPESGLELPGDKHPALVLPMPDCHTAEDCLVWFPGDRVLFVGDIFGWGLIPWDAPLSRAKLDHILDTYGRLLALDPAVVVPGHGPLCTAGELRRWQRYVQETVTAVKALASRGVSPRKIGVDKVPPPEDMHEWWRFLKWKHADTVKKIAHAVGRGRL